MTKIMMNNAVSLPSWVGPSSPEDMLRRCEVLASIFVGIPFTGKLAEQARNVVVGELEMCHAAGCIDRVPYVSIWLSNHITNNRPHLMVDIGDCNWLPLLDGEAIS